MELGLRCSVGLGILSVYSIFHCMLVCGTWAIPGHGSACKNICQCPSLSFHHTFPNTGNWDPFPLLWYISVKTGEPLLTRSLFCCHRQWCLWWLQTGFTFIQTNNCLLLILGGYSFWKQRSSIRPCNVVVVNKINAWPYLMPSSYVSMSKVYVIMENKKFIP